MKEDYWKALKRVTLFFLSNPVPFNSQNYHKQKEPGASDQLLFSLINKFKKSSFISYVLSDQVWWCNIKQLLSYFENYICKFIQVNLWHKLFHFHLSFWIRKVWKGRQKTTKIWISWERKKVFRWDKNYFA